MKVCKDPVPQLLDHHLDVDQAPLALDAEHRPSASGDTNSAPENDEVTNCTVIDLPVVVDHLPDVDHEVADVVREVADVGSLDEFLDFANGFDRFLGKS